MWKKNPLVKVYVLKLNNMMIVKITVFYVTSENTPVRKRMLKAAFLQLNRNTTSTRCWCNDDASKENVHFDAQGKQVFYPYHF